VGRRFLAVAVIGALAAGCGSGGDDVQVERAAPPSTTSTTAPSTTTTAAPTTTVPPPPGPTAATALRPPKAAEDPAGLAAQIVGAERAIRDAAVGGPQLEAAALVQQVAYRQLGRHPEWDDAVLAAVPPELHAAVTRNAFARREFRAMHTTLTDAIPAWRIVPPAPADELLAHYREAEAMFGIPWQVLAAVNLVETGMGRIRGTSVSGAQGPMQFMPRTWDAFGEGDINNPRDAILAAGRYLSHNHGATNIEVALWNYNHSDHYVQGVIAYADVMREDERAFLGYYHWGVFYLSTLGDIWLPQGFEAMEKVPAADYLAANPQ
jgi:membrane-bound lytic murein transglycosylase B